MTPKLILSAVLASTPAVADVKDAEALLDQIEVREPDSPPTDISDAFELLRQLKVESPEDADTTVPIGVFYQSTQKAAYRQMLNIPLTNPPIVIDTISCEWTYVDPLGGPAGLGRSTVSDLRIMPGDGYAILADRTHCVTKVACETTVRVLGTLTTRKIFTDLLLPQGDCLVEASRPIVR